MDTLTVAWPWRKQYVDLQPGFEYAVVSLDGRATIMALGERKEVVTPRGPERHEYWYSSQHEMLHTVNGRVLRALGFTVEWRAQVSSPPSWADAQTSGHEVLWSRVLDIMPGYRFGQVDGLKTRHTRSPTDAPESVPANAAWFEDSVVSTTAEGRPWAFRQRFAVLSGQVVYSEQCLSPKICLSLRPLPREGNP
jgi:hypothetical protein